MSVAPDAANVLVSATGLSRFELWVEVVRKLRAKRMLELGVWSGAFAEQILRQCPEVEHYFMIDPWKKLDNWNKPANVDQARFDAIYAEAIAVTDFAADRRVVLRGTTTETIDSIPDNSLDIAYIDGDHTLRGISIDLIRTWPKVKPGGVLAGDDYSPTIWQHAATFEPTLICPFARYFAEAQGALLIVLPYNQFAMVKPSQPGSSFGVVETVPGYGDPTLLWQISKRI